MANEKKLVTLEDLKAAYDTQYTIIAAAYNSATTYNYGDYVIYEGKVWRSKRGANASNTPTTPSDWWAACTVIGQLKNVRDEIAPAFSVSETYDVGQYCTYEGELWRCKVAITSTGNQWSGTTNWTKCLSGIAGQVKATIEEIAETWVPDHEYNVGDYISRDRKFYRMTVQPTTPDHTWSGNAENHWIEIPDIANDLLHHIDNGLDLTAKIVDISSAYDSNATYMAGEYVNYDGNFYKSKSDWNTGNTPSASLVYWERISIADDLNEKIDSVSDDVSYILAEGINGSGKKDRSFNIKSLATVTAARYNNGNPAYTGTLDCVEFSFDMDDVRASIPDDLSHGIDLMLFGMNDDERYGTRYIFTHNGTAYKPDTNYTPRTGKRLVPNYEDLDTVAVYVFGVTNPTGAEIEAIKQDLTAKVCDMINYSVNCSSILASDYSLINNNYTVFDYGDENVQVKTIQHISTESYSILDNQAFRVFSSSFVSVSSSRPGIGGMGSNNSTNEYIFFNSRDNANLNPGSWDNFTFIIPKKNNVCFWAMLTKYIGADTLILDNKTDIANYFLSEKDIAAVKSQHPFLGDYCGPFDRVLNSGKVHKQSNLDNPPTNAATVGYSDVLTNGKNGDWYIYTAFSDLCIKDKIAAYGDIIYRNSATEYLVLDNPVKWSNYDTVPPKDYDIVIVGGGAGGIGAAYALRNSGLRVLIADKMNGLGGTHTQAGLHYMLGSPVGDWFKPLCEDAYNCGALRFHTWNTGVYTGLSSFDDYWKASSASFPKTGGGYCTYSLNFNSDWLSKRYHDDITGGGIEVRLRRKFLRHTEMNGRIISLVFLNELTGAEEKVTAKYVIDCTADIHVGRYNRTLDTDFYLGTDPYSRFHEAAAANIETGDHYEINTCEVLYRYGTHSDGNIIHDYSAFTNTDAHSDAGKYFPTIEGVSQGLNGSYVEGYFADPGDAEGNPFTNGSYYPPYAETISPDYHCGITAQMLIDYGEEMVSQVAEDYAKAHYAMNRKTTARYFIGKYPLLGIRETYRMKCEYMVTQSDVEDTITSSNLASKNIVALSSWYADIHRSDTSGIASTYKNGIPYLAMVPTTYTNLLIACRGYGASHIGLSGIRLIKNMMGLGRAAGLAAKQCIDSHLTDVRDVNVSTLQTAIGIASLMSYMENTVYPYIESL